MRNPLWRWFYNPFEQRRCPHVNQRGIYGDEINMAGGNRSRCLDCGKLLPSLPAPTESLPAPVEPPRAGKPTMNLLDS